MAETISLADLKKQNEEEAPKVEEPVIDEPIEPEAEDVQDAPKEDEKPEETDTPDEDGGDEEGKEEAEVEPWMQSEEDEGDDPAPALSDSQAAQIRRKYKAPLKEAKSEIESLRKEIESLKNKRPDSAPAVKDQPKRDDFDSDEDWIDALTTYKGKLFIDQQADSTQEQERQRKAQAEQERVQKLVDDHYLRASSLADKSGIKPEAYQSADMKVRQAIDGVFQGMGDDVADRLISLVGEGSEKVFYHLGVNPAKRAKFIETFSEDSTGLAAAAFLGRLNAELGTVKKRESTAPPPGEQIAGDNKPAQTTNALKKKYAEAHKSGDLQKAYNFKKQAKEAGHDVRGW